MTAVDHPASATAANEHAAFVPAEDGDLLAVVTRPTGPPNGLAAVLLRGGGWRPSSGPRRTQVRLARRLAASGFHGVRFSYHGVAESSGRSEDVFRLDQPFVGDVGAIVGWVRAAGLRPVLVGNCFGARTALSYASDADDVAGLVLVVPPVHDFEVARRLDRRPVSALARRATIPHALAVLRDPTRRRALGRTVRALTGVAGHKARVVTRRVRGGRVEGGPTGDGEPAWISKRFGPELGAVVDRGVPVLFVYGDDDNYGRDFATACAGALGGVVERAGPLVTVRHVPGRIHGLTSIDTQTATMEAIVAWLAEVPCGRR